MQEPIDYDTLTCFVILFHIMFSIMFGDNCRYEVICIMQMAGVLTGCFDIPFFLGLNDMFTPDNVFICILLILSSMDMMSSSGNETFVCIKRLF